MTPKEKILKQNLSILTKVLKRVRQDFINSGAGENEWMHKRLIEIDKALEKIKVTPNS